jgi:hypothetical protein
MSEALMAIAVISSLASTAAGTYGSFNAAGQQKDQSEKALALQQLQLDYNKKIQEPYVSAGQNAVNQLSAGVQKGGQFSQTQPTLNQLQIDPGYAFRQRQGVNALQASGAAAGNYGSGNLGTALVNYGQEMGSQEYQNAYDRWMQGRNTQWNQLASLAAGGEGAVQQLGNTAFNTGVNMSRQMVNPMESGVGAELHGWDTLSTGFNNLAAMIGAGQNASQGQANYDKMMDIYQQSLRGQGGGQNYLAPQTVNPLSSYNMGYGNASSLAFGPQK